MTHNFFSRQ